MNAVRACLAVVTGAATLAAIPAQARDVAPPVIVKAMMIDADRDDSADRVRIVYSEPVVHKLDDKAPFPLAVDGYKVKKIGASKGTKSLTIVVAEQKAPDVAATPTVAYSKTTSNPVRDLAKNQAKAQTFRKTTPLDLDGDGYAVADCQKSDPNINPGVIDRPDLEYVDVNCDEIDGSVTDAVFVAPTGADLNAGTPAQPVATMSRAIELADETGKDVYAAAGSYEQEGGLMLVSDVAIYGDFVPGSWQRPSTDATEMTGAPYAAKATSDTGVVLQDLTLMGRRDVAGSLSAYGLVATDSSLTLQRVIVEAEAGAAGTPGTQPEGTPRAGAAGWRGVRGAEDAGSFCSTASQPLGGDGGASPGPLSSTGGAGGNAQKGTLTGDIGQTNSAADPGDGVPAKKGDWNPTAEYVGEDGDPGAPGAVGDPGSIGWNSFGYTPADATQGGGGGFGEGGAGGGGGGGGDKDCDSYGGSGGGGGAGGEGGLGGTGGKSGGASIAIYLWNSELTLAQTAVVTSSGGAGGNGGAGRQGAAGGAGGWGGDPNKPNAGNPYGGSGEQEDGSNGGRGGKGGAGGDGGSGGGGAGGPSVGIVIGAGSTVVGNPLSSIGQGGQGGDSPGTVAGDGPDGLSAITFTPLMPTP